SKRTLNSALRHGSFAAFWLHNYKGRHTRCCNPTSSKFIHTWLRFGEIMRGSLSMVHPGGFEPPTARFVAEYSIQLSYGCIGKIYFTADIDIATKAISSKRWCIREDYSPCGSPFGPLLKQRYHPWCLRLIPLPLRYLHC